MNILLLKKLKKNFNFSLGKCKKILEINNWNYNASLKYIKNFFIINNNNNKYKYYNILNILNNNIIYIIKIKFNSSLLISSNIFNNFKNKIKNLTCLIKEKIIFELKLLSISLNENIFLEKFIFFKINNNYSYYNHNNIFFCLIKFNFLNNKNICYHLISIISLYLNKYKCKLSLLEQNFVKNNSIKVKNILKNNILFFFIINNKYKFIYE
ncbi:putative elongation factor EF-Ts [Candidatus Carsonella ruddii CS isolate Thao2000]|uniref:Putative elongation factor EF-Ts n=1 Tax=Candidatus Carsonella ruddii CS isolate Thao2000 TaxID=1202537 RepID=J7GT53_CARRU|nr:hypothetical protein [Candidatus Carsonella ruddii]AFP83684.1 putative elongation factor EF-Ts [Candidatus Carsonella ruddii CS isolate Thao2000]